MKTATLFVLLLVLFSCSSVTKEKSETDERSFEEVSKKVIADLLARPDYMMYNTGDVVAMHYAEVCAAFGAARIAGSTGDTVLVKALAERYSRLKTDSLPNTANHVDANVYGILPLELFVLTGDSAFYRQGIELADSQWKDSLPNGLTRQTRFWIDDVYMIGSLQIQAYRVTGKSKYLDRAALETVAYLDSLQESNGLFHHGPEASFFWGRGNGWVAAGLAEVLSELPPDHQHYARIEAGYKKMMAALLSLQTEDGMWRQLLDVESAWKETSCTGMFAYAMAVGIKTGILTDATYRTACIKAWNALTGYIDEAGKMNGVCVGTGQSTDINYYLNRPTVSGDFHGQAPVLWLANVLIQLP
ncbi:glycoside hydrolase family 88/105 protein [Maribellus sediminis]|uniref:glycoside hydrolase family 88/105 protein n=1 Tax=Maribellus sediminis TaxID=2696285 RepID=UPI00142F58C1|nr:glycoside hydrolase family 88 protein [Maribellus sediminis]